MDFTQLLRTSTSKDRTLGAEAERRLADLERENLPAFMGLLCQELADDSKPDDTRQAAGLMLKNLLDAKDAARRAGFVQRWLSLDENIRMQVKAVAMQALGARQLPAARSAALVVSKIGLIELEKRMWPTLIPTLLQNVTSPNPNARITALETLGYICDDVDPSIFDPVECNSILTAVIQGLRKEEPELTVRLAAMKALNNALIFVKQNFNNPNERNFIMQTVCEALITPAGSETAKLLRIHGYECVVRIADLYYEQIPDYMNALGQLTFNAISNEDEDVGRMAIEFWCTLCDEEIERKREFEESVASGIKPTVVWYKLIEAAAGPLTNLLLQQVTKVEEDLDDDNNISTSAGTCLTLVANTVGDGIVDLVLPFINSNFQNVDWKLKASAILTFGYILEAPSDAKIEPLVAQALPLLLATMKDLHDKVKDSAAWTLSRVCEFHATVVEPYLPQLITCLAEALKDVPRVANNACWALHFIAEGFSQGDDPSNVLSQYFQIVLQALLDCSARDDGDEANLRISSYEVVNSYITNGAKDTVALVGMLIPGLLQRFVATFQAPVMSLQDKEDLLLLQGLLCGVFTTITNKIGQQILPHVDHLMAVFLQVFTQQSATVQEEALMAVSAVASAIGANFQVYADRVMPYVLLGLRNFEEYEVCGVAIGCVGDICRALEKGFLRYSTDIIQLLMEDLKSSNLDNCVKPAILGVFGDIAMAVRGDFVQYVDPVMHTLHQAAFIPADPEDSDSIDYVNQVRESVCEAYVGIIQGLSDDKKQESLAPYLQSMFEFIAFVGEDKLREEDLLRQTAALLGDLVSNLQTKCAPFVRHPSVVRVVQDAVGRKMEEGRYAKDVISKFIR